jgi:hypothetical protein
MASPEEIDRIAATMNLFRPDWRVDSLVTFLTKHHAGRPGRDLAVAAIYVATDTRTSTPNLLNQHGPWWAAAPGGRATDVSDHRFKRCPETGHGSFPEANCSACRADAIELEQLRPAATDATPEQLAVLKAGAAAARAALAEAKR